MAEERKARVDNVGAFSNEQNGTNDEKLELRYSHIVLGFSVAGVFSSAILLSHFVSIESVFMLITFNFLFVSLTFPLNGSLAKDVASIGGQPRRCIVGLSVFSFCSYFC